MTDDHIAQLERFCHHEAAEFEALRSAFQMFVVTILSSVPKRAEMFSAWQKAVLDRFVNETKLADTEDRRRAAELGRGLISVQPYPD